MRIEIRDGREYRVTVLPEAKPPPRRSKRTHYRFGDVGRGGDTSHKPWPMQKPKKR